MKRVEKIVLILLIVIMSFHTPIISYGYTAVPSDQDPFDSGYSPEFPSMEGIIIHRINFWDMNRKTENSVLQ